MAYPTNPAQTFIQATSLAIFSANQLYEFVNGDINTSIETEEGGLFPSIAKAIYESAAYKAAIPWVNGELQEDLMQPRIYAGVVYVPRRTPTLLGSGPVLGQNGDWIVFANTTFTTDLNVNGMTVGTGGNTTNTILGNDALLSNTSGDNITALGNSSLSTNVNLENCTGVGYNSQVTAINQVQLGDSATTTFTYGAVQSRSDGRDKADVQDTQLGLEFINSLRPVDYKWDMRDYYLPEAPEKLSFRGNDVKYKQAVEDWKEACKLSNRTPDGSKKRERFHHGFIAQEVEQLIKDTGVDFGGFQDHSVQGGDDVLSIGYEELIAPMVKAIQELKAEIELLKSK